MLASGERIFHAEWKGGKEDPRWEQHMLEGQAEAHGAGIDPGLPVKTKIRDIDRLTQFRSSEAKQTQSGRLSPLCLKTLCKTQRKPGSLSPAPLAI